MAVWRGRVSIRGGTDTLHVLPHYKETSVLALPQLGIDWGHWDKPVIPACRRHEAEVLEFRASLGYRASLRFKRKQESRQ